MLKINKKFFFRTSVLFLTLFLISASQVTAGQADLNFDGVFEYALDLPRILFLMKRDPNGEPLLYEGNFEINWAFLDTGASGLLLSKETTDFLEISIHPDAEYIDVGVGGFEAFDVSEPLYFATYIYDLEEPNISMPNTYLDSGGPWRVQVKQSYAGPWPDEPIDLMGMPVMAGKTVILYPGLTNELGLFASEIVEPNSLYIPAVDFNVPLRFEKYVTPNLVEDFHIPPLPVLAYNPVIDNVVMEYGNESTTATLLLDTGGTISLMSTARAADLGLTDEYGTPIVPPDFNTAIGGIGGIVEIDGYQIDNLILPTLNGYNLAYNNARIFVHDISVIDEDTGEFITLDGIFGSNFLCASAKIEGGWPVDLAETPYEHIVIDTQKALLGFDVNDVYPLPACGDEFHPQPEADLNGDCTVDNYDYQILVSNFGRNDCNAINSFCDRTDIDKNGKVNVIDVFIMRSQWLDTPFDFLCNQQTENGIEWENPWPAGDLNHDCKIDFADIQILLEEWLEDCNALNWNCRQADINGNGTVDFYDYAAILKEQTD